MQIILGQWEVYSKGFVRERKGASTEELARREDACWLVRVDVDGHRVTQGHFTLYSSRREEGALRGAEQCCLCFVN